MAAYGRENAMVSARAGSAPTRPTSQASIAAASARRPGFSNGTSSSGTPSRVASRPQRLGLTPAGSPAGPRELTSRKFDRLMPARSTPVGAKAFRMTADATIARVLPLVEPLHLLVLVPAPAPRA